MSSTPRYWATKTVRQAWARLRPTVLGVVASLVTVYRLTLRRPIFIGVTGSVGKTTTKEMIATVLASRWTGYKSPGTNNVLKAAVLSVLRTKRDFGYCVQEFGVGGLGEAVPVEKQFRMFKPQIAVVTTVGDDHIDAHGSREAIAAAKGKLVAAIPASGTAVLNADDHLVLAMRTRSRGRVLTYGLSPDAEVRGDDIRSDWPNRLSLTVSHGGESVRVQTQFCGAHLVTSVLASIAVGRAAGLGLQEAATAIEGLAPVPGRMCPVESPDGVTFIQDDVKAPVWTFPPALEFLREADAKRTIIIVGNLSDYQEPLDPTYAKVARAARDSADFVFFVGRWATRALKAKRSPDDESVRAFVTVDHINDFLRDFLEPGDLVLIKGSHPDRLGGIIRARLDQARAAATGLPASSAPAPAVESEDPVEVPAVAQGIGQLVVGLGNPGERYLGTPHNVGQQALDHLAQTLGLAWSEEDFGLVARTEVLGQDVLLVKAGVEMNRTGPWMRELADQAGLRDRDCLFVHDDINLKPGVVRNRMGGSSGGHKGAQSIVAAFQSEDVRKVKIGVGLPPEGTTVTQYVLSPAKGELAETMDKASAQAASRVMDMLKLHVKEAEAAVEDRG
ncbi:MAG: aminoacyl-tRNA hydrolase [Actinobacteria bacterium]|nr:aminoacyl-tRNA hydrolase [Actinomycetota bacterium]